MSLTPDQILAPSNPLAPHYSRFRVADRLLLTGHSHQAWPDASLEGQQQAWLDAAEMVDGKWEAAFARAERVREGYRGLMGGIDGEIALAANTHELIIRFLSALDLRRRPRLVTTDGEFHTIRRQLDRLEEAGVEVVRVAADPAEGLSERLAAAVDGRTAAVLASTVFYRTARIVRDLSAAMAACQRAGAELLLDVYHHLNVVPFAAAELGVQDAFLTGAGYKYCQLGEGAGFLRIPPGRQMRPVITGWFSEFTALFSGERGERVPYGTGPDRWAGATYDPTSHYRAASVFDFFDEMGLDVQALREVSQRQMAILIDRFDALDMDPTLIRREREVPLRDLAGFLSLESPHAQALHRALRDRGVLTDARGTILRFGPAPYLSPGQLEESMRILGECVDTLPHRRD
jgi:kynureninase